MSNFMSSIKASIVKALGGEIPQESAKAAAPKVVYTERPTALSKPQSVEGNGNGKPVDAVDHLHSNFVKALPANAAKDGRLANALTGVEMLTQEAINAKLRADRQKAALKQERAVAKAIKQIDARRKDLALAVVVNNEKRDSYVEQTEEAAKLNNRYIETRFDQPIDIQALAEQARKERAAQAAKRSNHAAANQGSKQPGATQSKTTGQRQSVKPPATKERKPNPINSLSTVQKENLNMIGNFLVAKGCDKQMAAKKAYALVTAADSKEGGAALTGIPTQARAELLPLLVQMQEGVYGPLYTPKKEETKLAAPVNNGPSNPMEDEVNPEVTVSAAPSTRDVSPLNNSAGKTQEVLPAVDGKI